MAKVLVSFNLIREALFPDSYGVNIIGVESWDTLNAMVAAIEIEGDDVPECDWVDATVIRKFAEVSFAECSTPPARNLGRRVE